MGTCKILRTYIHVHTRTNICSVCVHNTYVTHPPSLSPSLVSSLGQCKQCFVSYQECASCTCTCMYTYTYMYMTYTHTILHCIVHQPCALYMQYVLAVCMMDLSVDCRILWGRAISDTGLTPWTPG